MNIPQLLRRALSLHRFLPMAGGMLLLLSACDSAECPLNNTVYTTYGFYVVEDGKQLAVQVQDTLTVTAVGTDSILLNRMPNAASVELPMSYYASEDTLSFAFTHEDGHTQYDTIWVNKTNYTHYESTACPTAMFHYVNGVRSTHRAIDTVLIVNPNVDYHASENFQILFHTAR